MVTEYGVSTEQISSMKSRGRGLTSEVVKILLLLNMHCRVLHSTYICICVASPDMGPQIRTYLSAPNKLRVSACLDYSGCHGTSNQDMSQ